MELWFFIGAVLLLAIGWQLSKAINAKIAQNKYKKIIRKEKIRQKKLKGEFDAYNKQVKPVSARDCQNNNYSGIGEGTEVMDTSDLFEPTGGDWDIDKGWPHQGVEDEDRSSNVEWDNHDTRSSWESNSNDSSSSSTDTTNND